MHWLLWQEGSLVGHAGVGVLSLKGASLSLPYLVTSAFREYFSLGRLFRCVLPFGQRCIWLWSMVFRVLMTMLRSMARLIGFLRLLCASLLLSVVVRLVWSSSLVLHAHVLSRSRSDPKINFSSRQL